MLKTSISVLFATNQLANRFVREVMRAGKKQQLQQQKWQNQKKIIAKHEKFRKKTCNKKKWNIKKFERTVTNKDYVRKIMHAIDFFVFLSFLQCANLHGLVCACVFGWVYAICMYMSLSLWVLCIFWCFCAKLPLQYTVWRWFRGCLMCIWIASLNSQ